jgi:hypothetical protein
VEFTACFSQNLGICGCLWVWADVDDGDNDDGDCDDGDSDGSDVDDGNGDDGDGDDGDGDDGDCDGVGDSNYRTRSTETSWLAMAILRSKLLQT